MHRQALLNLLYTHVAADPAEAAMCQQTIQFVAEYPDCFERTLLVGHVTGSAWIVSPDRTQVLLIHHRKLDRWFQPGGHCDGNPDVQAVAVREAEEETGLRQLRLVSPAIFDVDVHTIHARSSEPEHLHYDIRFLLEADPAEPLQVTGETKGIRWVQKSDVPKYTQEKSIFRMLFK